MLWVVGELKREIGGSDDSDDGELLICFVLRATRLDG
jgi:hypothetical protein